MITRNNCHADIYPPGCVPSDVKPVVVGAAELIPSRQLPRHVTQYVHVPPASPDKSVALVDLVKTFE